VIRWLPLNSNPSQNLSLQVSFSLSSFIYFLHSVQVQVWGVCGVGCEGQERPLARDFGTVTLTATRTFWFGAREMSFCLAPAQVERPSYTGHLWRSIIHREANGARSPNSLAEMLEGAGVAIESEDDDPPDEFQDTVHNDPDTLLERFCGASADEDPAERVARTSVNSLTRLFLNHHRRQKVRDLLPCLDMVFHVLIFVVILLEWCCKKFLVILLRKVPRAIFDFACF
jgi:hypothetical protein